MRAKESKRMTSIARRINRHHVADLFWTLAFINIAVLATILVSWCYTAEKAALGQDWMPNLLRSIEWVEGKSFSQTLPTVQYIFSLPQGELFRVPAGTQLMVLYRASFSCHCRSADTCFPLAKWQRPDNEFIITLA